MLAAPAITRLPVSVDPVKLIFRISGCLVISLPRSLASAITLNTPVGIRCFTRAAKRSVVRGVVAAGLSTTVLPASSAAGTLKPINTIGKFHGTIAPTTPSGL